MATLRLRWVDWRTMTRSAAVMKPRFIPQPRTRRAGVRRLSPLIQRATDWTVIGIGRLEGDSSTRIPLSVVAEQHTSASPPIHVALAEESAAAATAWTLITSNAVSPDPRARLHTSHERPLSRAPRTTTQPLGGFPSQPARRLFAFSLCLRHAPARSESCPAASEAHGSRAHAELRAISDRPGRAQWRRDTPLGPRRYVRGAAHTPTARHTLGLSLDPATLMRHASTRAD